MTIQYFPAQFNIFPYLLNCLLHRPIKGGGNDNCNIGPCHLWLASRKDLCGEGSRLNIPIHSNTFLYISIQSYKFQYIPIHSYAFIYIPIYLYTLLNSPLHSFLFLYIPWHSIGLAYIPVYSYTFLYIPVLGKVPLNGFEGLRTDNGRRYMARRLSQQRCFVCYMKHHCWTC